MTSAFLAKIRLGWKCVPVTNTVAYFSKRGKLHVQKFYDIWPCSCYRQWHIERGYLLKGQLKRRGTRQKHRHTTNSETIAEIRAKGRLPGLAANVKLGWK